MRSGSSKGRTQCRTCYETTASHFYPLNERLDEERFPQKCLGDLLWDVAKIDVKGGNDKELPMQLCGNCSRKLKNAYSFVVQAQHVNEYLLANIQECYDGEKSETQREGKPVDCLVEAPIDIPGGQELHIKLEVCEDNLYDTLNALAVPVAEKSTAAETSLPKKHLRESRFISTMKEESAQECVAGNVAEASSSTAVQMKLDPITVAETNWQLEEREGDDGVDAFEQTGQSEAERSESDVEEYKLKRRRGRPRLVKRDKVRNADNQVIGRKERGRFRCDICNKSFAWKKDLYRHADTHFGSPKFQCDYCERQFLRKDKLKDHMRIHAKRTNTNSRQRSQRHPEWNFAERLYSDQRFRLICCKLCEGNFQSTTALRVHMLVHADPHTLVLQLDSEVVKELFPLACTAEQLEELKASISEDIAQQRLAKYYAVVNAHGYELSVSDSDADADAETDNSKSRYYCEICEVSFARKHQIFKHMTQDHALDSLPYKCNVCKLDFVCNRMYALHMRTQCRSKEKKYQCLKCPGKFMWLENLESHQCSNKFNTPEYKAKLPLKRDILPCTVCGKTFVWAKDLKRHQESHASDGSSHECAICLQRFRKAENLRQHMRQLHDQLKRRIECTLCNKKCETLKQLRAHLLQHADGCSGVNVAKGKYFKVYWPQGVEGHETEMTGIIVADFAAQQLSRYYSAVDESGNELDLNDSETDAGDDTASEEYDEVAPKRYTCEVCDVSFDRRKRALLHQHSEHADMDVLPHECANCNKQFVCAALLQQHERCDCQHKEKPFQCAKCAARFMWEENLQQHEQLKHIDPEQQISRQLANKLQCDECDKVFIWPKDLTRHKRVHMPDDEKFECDYCDRKFNRKDNLRSHLKVHGAAVVAEATQGSKKEQRKSKKSKGVDINLCKPHGCKCIQCMICLSKHSKIADLRTHLRTHQYVVSFAQRVEPISELSLLLYPEEPVMEESKLIARIMADITAQQLHCSFYSITNEVGYELDLDSSETESDSEAECETKEDGNSYACDLCKESFARKYKLFEHQRLTHRWEDAPHACSQCSKRFVCRQLLQLHCRQQCKNTGKRYSCRKCMQRFMWKDNLKMHLRTAHSDLDETKKNVPDSYDCNECHRSYKFKKHLTRHLRGQHSEAKTFKCLWCPRQFFKRVNLNMHLSLHEITPEQLNMAECHINASSGPNGIKQIYCRVCSLQFKSIGALRTHLVQEAASALSTHHAYDSPQNYSITNERGFELQIDDSHTEDEDESAPQQVYTCVLCTLTSKRKYRMALHQRSMHKQEQLPFKCEKCIFRSVSTEILEHHMRTQCYNNEKPYECEKCNFKFMWPENLQVHMQLMHPKVEESAADPNENVDDDNSNTTAQTESQLFQCDRCPRHYNRKDRLTAHVKKVHTEGCADAGSSKALAKSAAAKLRRTAADPKAPIDKKFLCAFCGRAVTSSSNLIIHMRRHTGEKPFKCDFCDMAFPRSSDLSCHRRTHTGEKPHRCTVCDKAFSRSYKLHTHMRIHSGERPYKCTYCEKSFTQSNDLTLHVRRHTGERPYVCGICGERFIQGTALKNHRTMRGHYEEVEPRRSTLLEQL